MNRFQLSGILFLLMLSFTSLARQQEFNADSAYAYTEYLSVTLGPRLMGSHNEQAALRWSAGKFASFGADTSYVLWFNHSRNGVNTRSGTAVGVFPGSSDSIIVVGGHIDSDKWYNPGASDNASGAACTIELARLWSKLPRRYTMIFCTFGAEESNLVGSRDFVKRFADIDKVALMFSIDMAGSEGWLIPFVDVKNHQAPTWLVKDAYAADRRLGYNDLEYPTHFFSINNALDGAGSDHMPFLERGIPAIDFTSGINLDPIHTPMDRMQFLSKPMLARSGRLVDTLLRQYHEQGIPPEKTGRYMLWQTFLGNLFIPHWLLIALTGLGMILGIVALLQVRKFRLKLDKRETGRFSTLKLFLLMIVIAIFTQLGEALLQSLKGLRYPWLTDFYAYLWLAALATLVGIWVALQATRRWKFSPDPYVYLLRAVTFYLLFAGFFSLASARLAVYPALALIAIALLVNTTRPWLRLLLTLLAPLPMFRLMFMEALPLLGRSMSAAGFQMTGFVQALIYSAILTALLVLWYLPALYLFAYTLRSTPLAAQIAGYLRRPIAGLAILLLFVVFGGYLFASASYSDKWKATLKVQGVYDMNSGNDSLVVVSNEYLRQVEVNAGDYQTAIDGRILNHELPLSFSAPWLRVGGSASLSEGEKMDTLRCDWRLISEKSWVRATLKLALLPDTSGIAGIYTDLNYEQEKGRAQFIWSAEPPDTIAVRAALAIPPGTRLVREVRGDYPFLPLEINASAPHAFTVYQTEVIYRDTLDFAP